MLSQNKKTIMITITSLVITGATLGGVVNAQQSGVNAQQSGVNAEQSGVNAQPVINTQQDTFNEQQYRFPPANAIQEIQLQKPAPVATQVSRPAANAQPPRPAQWYQWPKPAQRPMPANARPNYAAPGPYAPGPFASGSSNIFSSGNQNFRFLANKSTLNCCNLSLETTSLGNEYPSVTSRSFKKLASSK